MADGGCAQCLGDVLERRHRSRDVGVLNAAMVADSEAGLVMICVVICSQVRMRRMECCTQIVNV